MTAAVSAPAGPARPVHPEDVVSRLLRCAARRPHAPALVGTDGRRTLAELVADVERVAGGLRDAGVTPGDVVGVSLPRTTLLPTVLLGVMAAGAAYLPLDPSYPRARLRWKLEDTGARTVVATAGTAPEWADDVERVLIAEALVTHGGRARLLPRAPRDVAYVVYTSGSTGRPKGVVIDHANLASHLDELDAVLEAGGVWLGVTSPNFDPSVLELFWSLTSGGAVVLHDIAHGVTLIADLIRDHGITHVQGTPTFAHLLLDDPDVAAALAGVHEFLVGGEALTPALAARLRGVLRGGRLLNVYGPTETTVWSTLAEVTDDDVTVGRPLGRTTLRLVDEHLAPVPDGAVGEVLLAGPGLTRGYLGRPDLDAVAFVHLDGCRWYRTGDLGARRADGRIVLHGRRDHQVKVHGVRIELGEVEAALEALPGVARAVATVEGAGVHACLVAHVVPADGVHLDHAGVRTALARSLPASAVPSVVAIRSTVPTTPSGKVDRLALPRLTADVPETGDGTGEAGARRDADDAEGDLAVMTRLWSSVLPRPVRDVDVDFFDAGGTSLAAARLAAAVRAEFGVTLPLTALADHRTIRTLTGAVRAAARGPGDEPPGSWPLVVALRPGGQGVPVVLFHGRFGNVVNLVPLADRIRSEHPVLAVQARGLDGITPPHTDVATMADDITAELAPLLTGSVVLAGYSGGGVVALEVARRLRPRGVDVARVMLLDTALPGAPEPSMVVRVARRAQDEGAALPRFAVRWVVRRVRRLLGVPGASDEPIHHLDLGPVLEAAGTALLPYDGAVTVVRARSLTEPPDLGWGRWLTGPVLTVDVGGGHERMLRPPHVDDLAATVSGAADAAQRTSPPRERGGGRRPANQPTP